MKKNPEFRLLHTDSDGPGKDGGLWSFMISTLLDEGQYSEPLSDPIDTNLHPGAMSSTGKR